MDALLIGTFYVCHWCDKRFESLRFATACPSCIIRMMLARARNEVLTA